MAIMTTERPESEEDTDWYDERRQRAAVVRALHDQLDPPAGWRVEIVEGELVVSPAPVPAHGYIIEIIRTAVAGSLPPTFGAYENIELEEPESDRYIPDLGVWPRAPLRHSNARPHPKLCALAVEVTSPNQSKRDYAKAAGYARCGIPVYLVVDRQKRVCVVFTEPEGDTYRHSHQVRFGEPVTLPLEEPLTIETTDF